MPKSFQEKKDDKVEKYLAGLTAEAEAFALFGDGFPTSVCKVYVRASPKAKWWKFDHGVSPDVADPMKYQAGLQVKGRAAALWTPIARLNDYQHHPDKPAVVRLMGAVKKFASTQTKRCESVFTQLVGEDRFGDSIAEDVRCELPLGHRGLHRSTRKDGDGTWSGPGPTVQ